MPDTVTYTPIATNTLGSAAASVTFSSISGTYKDLVIVAEYAGFSSGGATTLIRLNNDSTTNRYSSTNLDGNGSTAVSDRYTSATGQPGMLMGGSSYGYGAGRAVEIFQINNYANSTTYKTVLSRFNQASDMIQAIVGLYTQTTAITEVTIPTYGSRTFSTGSTFTLYGIGA